MLDRVLEAFKKFIFSDKFTTLLRISIIIAIIPALYFKEWFSVLMIIVSFLLTYFNKFFIKYWIKIPKEMEIIIIVFIYWTLFLWSAQEFYYHVPYWDSIYHFVSWILLGFIGFILMYALQKRWQFSANLILFSIFVFCFASTVALVWEIYEYLLDELFWADAQQARWLLAPDWTCDSRLWVVDTMEDVIFSSIGCFISLFIWYKYLKNWTSFKWFDYLVKKCEKLNAKFFKRVRKKRKNTEKNDNQN